MLLKEAIKFYETSSQAKMNIFQVKLNGIIFWNNVLKAEWWNLSVCNSFSTENDSSAVL